MQQQSYKYWAFISYSHRDQAWAEWLHKALETYRVPRRLVGRETAAGPVPRRLFPVFRDLEELPSSPNLSGAIDQALQQSRYLIVIASPYAAVSKWVDQEIARFRALGRGDRILCLIVDGEPHADLHPGKGFLECFPPSLRAGDGIEPIAADVRPGKDGKPATKLKLIAGLLGVGLDELRRRERRRQFLRNASWIATCILLAAGLGGLWQMQQQEKREALAQQALHAHITAVYEKGRQELLAHNEARAAVFLNEAFRQGVDTPALRFMLARAMRIVDTQKLSFQTGAPVNALKFSPDANLIVTTGTDDIARVWEAAGNKRIELPLVQGATSPGPIFSRSGRLIYYRAMADGAASGILKVWDVNTGHLLADLVTQPSLDRSFVPFDSGEHRIAYVTPDHAVEIRDLSNGALVTRLGGNYSAAGFSRNGHQLLTGDKNGEVSLWDQSARHKIRLLSGLRSRIVFIDDTADGSLLAAAAEDGTIRVWETRTGAPRLVGGHPSPNPGLIFNIDGTRLLTWAADGDRVWNTTTGVLVYVQQSAAASSNRADISSSGRWLLTSNSSRLLMQDTESGADLFTLDGHRGLPRARDISDDDRLVATGGPDGRIVLWEMPRIPEYEFAHSVNPVQWSARSRPPGVAAIYSHDGKLIATGAGDGHIKIWDQATRQLVRQIDADQRSVNVLAFSADDTRLVSGGESDGVKVWDARSGQLLRVFDCEARRVLTLELGADGRKVSAAIRGGVTKIWDLESGAEVAQFHRDEAWAGRFSPDGKTFAIGIQGAVKLWDIDKRQFNWSTQLDNGAGKPSDDVSALDFSSDGARLLAMHEARAGFVLDVRDGHVLNKTYQPSSGQFNTARFAHHGNSAVISDRAAMLMFWNPDSGQAVTVRGHAGEVRSAVFSPDDSFVLTSGVDATAKLWDAHTGELLDTVSEHAREFPEVPFQSADFSPDGRWIITGSIDGVVRLWELREESRNSQQIDSVIRCRVPWKLDGEGLLPADPDATACPSATGRN